MFVGFFNGKLQTEENFTFDVIHIDESVWMGKGCQYFVQRNRWTSVISVKVGLINHALSSV